MRCFGRSLLCLLTLSWLVFTAPSRAQDAPDPDRIRTLMRQIATTDHWEVAVKELEHTGRAAAEAEPTLVDLLQRLSDPSDQWDVIKALRAVAGPEQPDAAAAYARIKRNNAMIDAALAGDQKAVEKELKSGADVNSRYLDFDSFFDFGKSGYTALMGAVLNGNRDLVTFLLSKGADVNAERRGKSAMTIAVLAKDQALIKLLKDAGAKADPDRIRLVHDMILAACMGYDPKPNDKPLPPGVPGDLQLAEPIATVIARGGSVNWPDEEGYTPLMYAANLGLVKNVQTLLAAGADPAIARPNGIKAQDLADAGARAGREGCGAASDLLKAKTPGK